VEPRTTGSPIDRVPRVKMPPAWFPRAMNAISGSDGSRVSTVRRLRRAFPQFTEKLAVRALVAPTMTRLHFARTPRGRFEAAPNGRIWARMLSRDRSRFTGLCLRDLLVHRLGLERGLASGEAIREEAQRIGPRARDRCRGYYRLLEGFPPPPSAIEADWVLYGPGDRRGTTVDAASFIARLRPDLEATASGRQVIDLDDLRTEAMSKLYSKGIITSSFAVDRALLGLMEESEVFLPFGGATNQMDSLVVAGRPFSVVRPRAGT
jgi:hypothetical protein